MDTKIKMERGRGDTDPRTGQLEKSSTNFIELNVDMNVTVSNVTKSKMFQRSRTVVLFLLVIAFAVVLSHLRKEVRALQVQMQSMNVNLLVLMSKYDRLNRSLNRAWTHRSDRFLEYGSIHDVKRLLDSASTISRAIEIFDGIHNGANSTSYGYDGLIRYSNFAKSSENEHPLHENGTSNESETMNRNSLMNLENDEINSRIERAALTVNKGNLSKRQIDLSGVATTGCNNSTDDDYDNDDFVVRREPRSGRSRRDEGRGPLVATFVGAIPEQHVTDTVYIGPWVKSSKNNTLYSLNKFHLVEDKKSIEVTATGLYMISAQIFYFGEPTNYSYWILLSSEGESTTKKLVKCSTASSTSATEVSCYTSVITPLQRGDRVHIQQQEKNRLINMREGHSYIQLVLLSDNIRRQRLR
ncbi:uncharacterized protein LOC116428363 isoform X2 [Nomia melanderi]|uniref:uncharacterized protein LOC116428363 isoform X2 n=1 Tax=Nomia melanderi TaxID=2448451 RepID=UPI0013042ABE|nr:uncharacterized protein LOC116428363 isoform X2 [Nomia melanderi]